MEKVMKSSKKLVTRNKRKRKDGEDSAEEIVNLEENQLNDVEQDVESEEAMEGLEDPICGTKGQNKKHTHHSYLYCTWCYELVTDVRRHMMRRCKERMKHLKGNDKDKEIYESAIEEEKKTLKNFLFNMCISPNEFEDRSYSKNELLELFTEYGHIVVPERFAATFKPPQRIRSGLATESFSTGSDP